MAFSIMQTISFIYLLVVWTCSASFVSHNEECLALFQFKQSILHQEDATFSPVGFQKFASWRKITSRNITSHDNGSDCCVWDGVVCGGEDQVIGLDLSESFSGRIYPNSSLFNLVHLQSLNLSMNDFSESQIPSEISRLKNLTILDLSASGFSGQIPKEISHLLQLSSLNLSLNPLKFQSPNLEYLLQNFTKLEELHISRVDINSSVPSVLGNFSSLRSIKLDDCQLQGEFPAAIFHLPKLKYLSMRNNPNLSGYFPEFHNNTLLEYLNLFSTGFAGIVPESISNLDHLTMLLVSGCSFSGRIPGSLSNLTQLTHLGLSLNKFTGLVPSLASLSKLILLELSGNNFDKGPMLDWTAKLTNLDRLALNFMNLYDEIPTSLANLTKLTIFEMGDNYISGRIPYSFMNLTQLTVIDFRGNQLQGPISSSFSNFKNLESLTLDTNNFSGNVYLASFLGLNKLEGLDLDANRLSVVTTNNYTNATLPKLRYLGLSGCNLKEFPAFLRIKQNLMGLFLTYNYIEGLVPVWIWNNSKDTMQIIDLSSNFITGFHQHPQFLPWAYLEAFNIAYNELQGRLPVPPKAIVFYQLSYNNVIGEIPPLICEIKSLRVLDLSSNNMTGTLPPCFGNLSDSLLVLSLKRNNFHGKMMDSFTHGSPLKMIDLSENQFIGQVSKSLANCTNLEVLALGDNSFDDAFPFWLGTHTELQVLILRNNKFGGTIKGPTNISLEFPKLRIIDLSNNGFSGQLPDKYFQIWNAMKSVYAGKSSVLTYEVSIDAYLPYAVPYSITLTNKGVKREYQKILNIFTAIDLSCNNFEGHIPQSLQDLHGLESLNISNNHLTGHILPSFGNLKNLESMDLSQNKLSGKIPRQLLQLSFLSILNVSFNHLNGIIPQGGQFYTFENNSYIGNPELCGQPLSKECENSKASTSSPTSNNVSESESLLPSNITDWIVIFAGVASGLVIGIVVGNILYDRYNDWFMDRFGMRKDKWVRPLRNTRRS